MTPTFVMTLSVVVIGFLFAIGFLTLQKATPTPQIIQVHTPPPPRVEPPVPILNTLTHAEGGDDRYTRAPEPLRDWFAPPDLRGAIAPVGSVPIFQPVRGYPEQFQQIGILQPGFGSSNLLPLFGRRTGNRSDRYNYYTRTDSYNPIQLPIRYQRRECMDDVGCEELLGGEQVMIDGLDQPAKVRVYKYDAPKYIPAVF